MTITERPSSAAEGEDLPRRALEAVCARGPIGLAEEIGDATHLLVELLREPQNLFDPEEHGSHDYTQLLGRIHEAGRSTPSSPTPQPPAARTVGPPGIRPLMKPT